MRRKKILFDQNCHSTLPWLRSKEFGYRFDLLVNNQMSTELVVCNVTGCRKIFNKDGVSSLSYHADFHAKGPPTSQAGMEDALLKFAVCSTQSFSITENKSFLVFLEAFRKISIDNHENGIQRTAKDLLPSRKTLTKWIDQSVDSAKFQVRELISSMKSYGGGLTIDFAKKQVDYIAVTAHFLTAEWEKIDFVILFSAIPCEMKKTSANVKTLVEDEMKILGIHEENWKKLFVTTDEGSNVNCLGGKNHQPCLAHVGATLAKRTTRLYKDSQLSDDLKNVCQRIESQLQLMEKLVGKLRKSDQIVLASGKALKAPVETRWMSYYNMVEAVLEHSEVLQEAVEQFSPQFAVPLRELINQRCFHEYLSVLEPIAKMVLDVQNEAEPTSNGILEHLANVWLNLKKKATVTDGNSLYGIAMAESALECFNKKIGDWSNKNWLQSSDGKLNRKILVCSSFLDPFMHGRLRSMGARIPALNYQQMKGLVLAAAAHLTPEDLVTVTPKKRKSSFACVQSSSIESQLNAYCSLPLTEEDPLIFWKKHEQDFPFLAPLAHLVLAVQASSSPSERAFKELRCVLVDFTRNRMSPERIASLVHLRTLL